MKALHHFGGLFKALCFKSARLNELQSLWVTGRRRILEDLLAGAIFRTVIMETIYLMQSSLTWLLILALQQRKSPHKKQNLEVILEPALRINNVVQRYNAQHISS